MILYLLIENDLEDENLDIEMSRWLLNFGVEGLHEERHVLRAGPCSLLEKLNHPTYASLDVFHALVLIDSIKLKLLLLTISA